ncbi:Heat shock protein 40 like protein/ DnaJ domain containing protein [Ectocarpus siliculosus]|uniref:Heat shock protein 40 like protein/ DnaJ domain containing protein n=1 Tax=Ectocarpus siliculosus TaxID=2880 RepID=D7FXR4_ECTSI|nr:Heat shock protein 40 like protein/ DnaJ domain containing protein [Ectocarpus siliculosus]|eukprot:CBJ32327.1 Heat shock protein 40 like protein/ DnaJ domain containing protein [Ectocarpus siliculosus]
MTDLQERRLADLMLWEASISAVLYVSRNEDEIKSPRTKKCVAILDRLAYGTWKCCWWAVDSAWKTITRYFQSYMDEVGVVHPKWDEVADELERCRREPMWKALRKKAQNHVRLQEWELAIEDFRRYLSNVGLCHKTSCEVSEELRHCRRELKAKEEKAKAADENRKKELLRTARNHKCLEQWESAIADYQRYLNDVGVRHPTWHEVADELDECRQKVEEKRVKAAEEKRKKVEDEKRKELLRKARSHKSSEQWELAITHYLKYLNDVGDGHPTSVEVAQELDYCRQEQAKVRAAEEERKAEDRRRKAADEAAQEEAVRAEGSGGGHYATLWVRSNAPRNKIKEAYRKLALRHHPDKNPGNSDAARQFRAINEAYEVLKDQGTRREYNRKLDDEERLAHNRRYDDFMRRRATS